MKVNTAFSREAYTVSIIYRVGYMFYGNPSQREQKNLAIVFVLKIFLPKVGDTLPETVHQYIKKNKLLMDTTMKYGLK